MIKWKSDTVADPAWHTRRFIQCRVICIATQPFCRHFLDFGREVKCRSKQPRGWLMTVVRIEQVLIKLVFYLFFHQGRGTEAERNCSRIISGLASVMLIQSREVRGPAGSLDIFFLSPLHKDQPATAKGEITTSPFLLLFFPFLILSISLISSLIVMFWG